MTLQRLANQGRAIEHEPVARAYSGGTWHWWQSRWTVVSCGRTLLSLLCILLLLVSVLSPQAVYSAAAGAAVNANTSTLNILGGAEDADKDSAAGSAPRVLLLYDSLAKGTEEQEQIATMRRLLAALGASVTYESMETYEQGTLASYDWTIQLIQQREEAQEALIVNSVLTADLASYKGKLLHIGADPPQSLVKELGIRLVTAREAGVSGADLTLTAGEVQQQVVAAPAWVFVEAFGRVRAYGELRLPEVGGSASSEGAIDPIHTEIVEGSAGVEGTSTEMAFPFAVLGERFAYIPQGSSAISPLALGEVLRSWLWDEPRSAEQVGETAPLPVVLSEEPQIYLTIKGITPFSDLNLLGELGGRLQHAGIPFIASARPVFSNTDFPAMERYLTLLYKLQANGGSIVLEAPVVSANMNHLGRSLEGQLTAYLKQLADFEIAPVGMAAELHWLYDQTYSDEALAMFDSLIVYPDDQMMPSQPLMESKDYTSVLYSTTWEELRVLRGGSGGTKKSSLGNELDQRTGSEAGNNGNSVQTAHKNSGQPLMLAVVIEPPTSEAELESIMEQVLASRLLLANYRLQGHTVKLPDRSIQAAGGNLWIDGKQVAIDRRLVEENQEYVYQEEVQQSFRELFQLQNTIFMIGISGALLFFAGLLLVGYRMYRRKFMREGQSRK